MKDLFFDPEGNPTTADKLEGYVKFKIVEQTSLKSHWISTVWLGINHAWGNSPPLIYETMVFLTTPGGAPDFGEACEQQRYVARADAFLGHYLMVARWTKIEAGDA